MISWCIKKYGVCIIITIRLVTRKSISFENSFFFSMISNFSLFPFACWLFPRCREKYDFYEFSEVQIQWDFCAYWIFYPQWKQLSHTFRRDDRISLPESCDISALFPRKLVPLVKCNHISSRIVPLAMYYY